MPRPAWAPTRESSRMLALGSQACSSRRTIRSPQRAVERQWIRRTSSPCRYSRTSTSSWPTTPIRCGRASPVLPAPPELRIVASGTTRGVTMTSLVATNCRSNWTSPNGSVVRTVSGPVGEPTPNPAEQRILHHPTPAQVGLVDQEPRPAAELAGHRILQQQDRRRQPALLAEHDLAGHRRSERHLGRLDGPLARHPQAGSGHQDHRNDRERGQQQADPHHVALAGGHGDQHDGHPGDEEEPAPGGQQAPGTRHRYLRSGMCTELMAWAITSVTERRAS